MPINGFDDETYLEDMTSIKINMNYGSYLISQIIEIAAGFLIVLLFEKKLSQFIHSFLRYVSNKLIFNNRNDPNFNNISSTYINKTYEYVFGGLVSLPFILKLSVSFDAYYSSFVFIVLSTMCFPLAIIIFKESYYFKMKVMRLPKSDEEIKKEIVSISKFLIIALPSLLTAFTFWIWFKH